MNTRSAKGKRWDDFNAFLDGSSEGDWFVAEIALWIHIPGTGVTYIPFKERLENGACWNFDGNVDAPTVTPSIHVIGQWHGWMRNGELVSC